MTPAQLTRQRGEIARIERWAPSLIGVTAHGARERVDRFRRFVTSRGIVRLTRGGCPCLLRSRRCGVDHGGGHRICCFQPDWLDLHANNWLDHRRLCTTASGERIFTSQPYELLDTDRERLREFVGRRGLKVSFSDEDSWWYPGETTLVVLTADPARVESVRRARAERGGPAQEVLLVLLRAYHGLAGAEAITTPGGEALRYIRDWAGYRAAGGDAFASYRPPDAPPPEVKAVLAQTVDRMTEAILGNARSRRTPKRSRLALEWLRDFRDEALR